MIEVVAATERARRQGLPRIAGRSPAGGSGPVPKGYALAASVSLGSDTESASAPQEIHPVEVVEAHNGSADTGQPIAVPSTRAPLSSAPSPRRVGLPRVSAGVPSGGSGQVPSSYVIASNVTLSDSPATASHAEPAARPSAQQRTANVEGFRGEAAPDQVPPAAWTGNSHAGFPTSARQFEIVQSAELSGVRRHGLPRVLGGSSAGGIGDVPGGYVLAERVSLLSPSAPVAAEPVAVPAASESVLPPTVLKPHTGEAATVTATEPKASATKLSQATQHTPTTKQPQPDLRLQKTKKPVDPEQRASAIKMLLAAIVGAVVTVAGIMVVRALLTTDTMQTFLAQYPGEYELPHTADPGFPAWVKWTHFLNFFFLVLIVRSGLQVRMQKKPDAYWTPKRAKGSDEKVSLALWFHQSLDILWLLNGIVFVVLLFVSGHWMRIIPTSWEVFPNAASAILQYLSLEWPTENGWVNYNSLQQLMYFIIVFVAAPLAALTGIRMSGMWPKRAKRLSQAYPIELARMIHFPTMIFFVAFVIVHVILVFTTGMRRNLNHMFGDGPTSSWVGFGIFALSILVTVGAWIAARPMILVAIARLSGKVSAR